MRHAIGLVELTSVAPGLKAADIMVKASKVELLQAISMCPGKFVILIAGEISAVQGAIEAGIKDLSAYVIGSLVLGNIHEDVFPALKGEVPVDDLGALGLIETFSVATAIRAADAAAKAAKVKLLEVRLARGMGGKAFVLLTGDVGAVTAAVDSASKLAEEEGMLVGTTILANPDPQLWAQIL
ncbi:Carboxysome shell and ethanolamine utilization microcompartment protein CcmL/EutN [Thermanaeromonas toyohensis ToBE]|uniref:Carboxysome shell and ethanolamine utilization microcompartment protein CcmL/EutN n=1 Tax=Thermanaeromonas toyohensis ToBE TaxID=698762 RepID=A0A1W1VC30_9FIRM|nr:BMC domain-containing protein [Thermanaeromonas toyohensis]SMB90959.1 Carboxysome shell and ethanolamine utilization microcompartment protein CcmL/EutN [Thermanaeromonas toyohensis ToBE]